MESREPIPALKSRQFWIVKDKFDFDNIAQSHPFEDIVYISCAECAALLGYLDVDKYLLAKDLVRTQL